MSSLEMQVEVCANILVVGVRSAALTKVFKDTIAHIQVAASAALRRPCLRSCGFEQAAKLGAMKPADQRTWPDLLV